MTDASYDVRFWKISERKDAVARYRVRWTVGGKPYARPLVTTSLAQSFRAQLNSAARNGESFDTETGLPQSLTRRDRDVSCYDHAREFVAAVWEGAAPKSRVSILETLSVVLPVLSRDLAGPRIRPS